MTTAPYTDEQAVAALKRIAKRWPKHLTLFSWSGSLTVIDNRHPDYDATGAVHEDAIVANIEGIPNGGGDPDHLQEGP
jgi:LmbE family N-acetylglucosaminyl deacetylase